MQLSELAKSINKSKIRVMYDRARLMGAEDILNFTVGEPDFATPKVIIDKANEYLSMGLTKYTPNSGVQELRNAVAEKYSPQIRPIDPNTEVMITMGATEAILVAMQIVLNPGDEIIAIAPMFARYLNQFKIVGCVPKIINTAEETGFTPTAKQIEASIGPKTKMILLNSPCNPTGAEIPVEELKKIAEVAIKHDLVVISDEVYKTIRYVDTPYVSIASFPGMAERTIVVDAFSKTYAMAGWRLGYAIGPEWLISKMPSTHDVTVACVNAPHQLAGAWALKNCDAEVLEMREIYRKRKDVIVSGIRSIPGLSCLDPSGTFYLWVNIKELGIRSDDFCFDLLDKQHVSIVPGTGFGEAGEGYVRITYAANEDMLSRGLDRIGKYVASIR